MIMATNFSILKTLIYISFLPERIMPPAVDYLDYSLHLLIPSLLLAITHALQTERCSLVLPPVNTLITMHPLLLNVDLLLPLFC